MGLAATQARFLAITSRKMNCEFQSMQVAQEKLSTTRDLQRAANEYQNSLDATKLIWDADNTFDGMGDIYNLSYDLMMKPSTLNDYTPYIITDTQGKVVLSNEMFRAAMEAGIIDKNGDPTFGCSYKYVAPDGTEEVRQNPNFKPFMGEVVMGTDKDGNPIIVGSGSTNDGSRNAFLYQLGQLNQVNGAMAKEIIAKGRDGYSRSGIGGPIFDKSTANALTTNLFENYMKTITVIDKEGKDKLVYGISDTLNTVFGVLDSSGKVTNTNNSASTVSNEFQKNDSKMYTIVQNGKPLTDLEISKLTTGDLLEGNYQIVYNGKDGHAKFVELLQRIAKIFGYGDEAHIVGLNVDTESNEALELAFGYTERLLSEKNMTNMSGDAAAIYNKAKDQTNIVHAGDMYSMSLTNLVESYLTNFARALDGLQTSYFVDMESKRKSNMVTDDLGYYFVIANDGAMRDQVDLYADFYNMLYNIISTSGACTDEMLRNAVVEESRLQAAIKNGTMFVTYLNDDGYFYQGPYTLTDKIAEVTDEDAIARAEREYEVTKSRLNAKEETLELKMKNLDMEISSLTTEFDTVKNMISKGIEKVFTMFNN